MILYNKINLSFVCRIVLLVAAALEACLSVCSLQFVEAHACQVGCQQNGNQKAPSLIDLDRQVSDFFDERYYMLDANNVTYDQQLLKSIKYIRHTIINQAFDYVYTSNKLAHEAQGSRVDDAACQRDMSQLVEFAKINQDVKLRNKLPLSVVNFLEANGRSEAGILNGNFLWAGSYTSCSMGGRIKLASLPNDFISSKEIRGRYCVGHLKAKSWPALDEHFGTRLSIKIGLCVPDTCHTEIYTKLTSFRQQVDLLARLALSPPFNGDNYEIDYLYCDPDDDSKVRQLRLGTKLFIAAAACWLLLFAYANYKYHQKLEMLHTLRQCVDIKMTISEFGEKQPTNNGVQTRANSKGGSNMPRVASSGKRVSLSTQASKPENKSIIKARQQVLDGDRFDFYEVFSIRNNWNFLFHNITKHADHPQDRRSATGIKGKVVAKDVLLDEHEHQEAQLEQADLRCYETSQEQQLMLKKMFGASQVASLVMGNQPNQQSEGPTSDNKQEHQKSDDLPLDERCRVAIVYNRKQKVGCRDETTIGTEVDEGPKAMLTISSVGQTSNRRPVNIDIFDGVKVVATIYIVLSHTLMNFYGLILDIKFWDGRMFDFVAIMLHNGLQVVGLFYIISGALLTYLTLIRYRRRQLLRPSFWLLVIINRYARLLPLYILVFWFAKHVAPFVGHGRGWPEYRTDELHPRSYCDQDTWTSVLTLTQDLKVPKGCVPQAWYLVTDFRTLFVMPVFIIILVLNRTAGYMVILATCVMSFFAMAATLRDADIDFQVLLRWKPHSFAIATNRLIDCYVSLATRISSYLLGTIIGHLLYLYKIGQIQRWPSWFEKYALKLACLTATMLFMGPLVLSNNLVRQFLPKPTDVGPELLVFLAPIFKLLMEISLSVILLVLVSGGGYRWLTNLLSSKTAKVLSFISYGVFMTHIELMFKLPSLKYETSYAYLFMGASYFVLTAHLVALFLHLFYEMPINNILRRLVALAVKPKHKS